ESRGGNQTGNSQGDQFFLHVFLLLNEVGSRYCSSLTYLSNEKLKRLCNPHRGPASRNGSENHIDRRDVAWMQQDGEE
ncbi:MAG: hypothetical protein KF909_07310, partial [Rhodocyclaceae bacterium]|nr:hypothetical protein [Rhodocyclaceae bacterium]